MLYHSNSTPQPSSEAGPSRVPAVGLIAGVLFLVYGAAPAAAEPPKVVASIKPVHSLVAAIMQGAGTPALIVKGAASPHTYALTPSDARAVQDAQIVFWVGEGMETFLHKAIESLPGGATSVELTEVKGVTVLPVREGGLWDEHLHEGEAHTGDDLDDEEHEPYDGHLWLDPANAKQMVAAIAAELSKADPANAALYRKNRETFESGLDDLDREISAMLAPVKDVPFIVFHDAYQYFDHHYGLAGVGSITVNPELPPGAKRLREIQGKIAAQQARCVFREPNFEPALVDAVVTNTDARTGVLDPEGASLDAGPDLYFQLIRGIAIALRDCLSEKS